MESRLQINLKAQAAGKIVFTSDKFLAGGFFDTDEIILKIDPSDYQLALIQAEVSVARAEQELSKEKELSELAKADWEKYSKGKATDLVLRVPQLREAESALKGAKANYETQRIQLSRAEVRAPFPLMVDQKQVDLGQVVSNNQELAAVFGTEEAEVRMPLSQKQINLLNISSVGILNDEDRLNVKIRDLSRGNEIIWNAKILRVEGSIDRKSRVYYAVATVFDPMNLNHDKSRLPLLPGVFVDVEVEGSGVESVFKVPIKAMRDDYNVYVIENSKLITKPVKVLDHDKEYATIISGINEGELICISPPWSYVPGMKTALAHLDGVPIGSSKDYRKGAKESRNLDVKNPNTSGRSKPDLATMTDEQEKAFKKKLQPGENRHNKTRPATVESTGS